jgi:AGCS family alanine or glycine:cation symporter
MMALQPHFSFDVKYLFACLIFIVGFATVQAYFVVGLKCAYFLGKNIGRYLYVGYAAFAYWFFAHYDASKVMLIMSLSGGGLILINLISLFRLRTKINFHLEDDTETQEEVISQTAFTKASTESRTSSNR